MELYGRYNHTGDRFGAADEIAYLAKSFCLKKTSNFQNNPGANPLSKQ